MSINDSSCVGWALLAAGGITRFHEAAGWRLNEALIDLDRKAHERGLLLGWRRHQLDIGTQNPVLVRPGDPPVQIFDEMLRTAVERGLVDRVGPPLFGELVVNEPGVDLGRALLRSLEDDEADLVREVGELLPERLAESSDYWREVTAPIIEALSPR